ncbi:MAG: Gfo/Idh/MocA family oxidoreductase [Clostridia bacterium]|nr:Gfo/Idh/MocA family oxidoreductase [Clostridia bacterium]
MLKIGVIGYGGRIHQVVTLLLDSGKCSLSAIADNKLEVVKERFPVLSENKELRYYDDAEQMMKCEQLDGVLIGTNCNSHTEYALLCAKYNMPMFLEKPVCTNYEDLVKLKAISSMDEKTVVSFPLRVTRLVEYIKDMITSGKLGELSQVQAYNNVPYASGYYHKWYRDDSITGGLFLQKATHDLDYIDYLLGDISPVRVTAMRSKQIFKGDKPAGYKCCDCPERDSCQEGPAKLRKNNPTMILGEYCAFAKDTGNEDSGSVIIEYDSGLHVVYTQNFVARNDAGKRGCRIIGYKGTVEFDFFTGVVTFYSHEERRKEEISFSSSEGHFGGDSVLVNSFISVMEGKDTSIATLKEGIRSAELCLAAKKSSQEHVFVDIDK